MTQNNTSYDVEDCKLTLFLTSDITVVYYRQQQNFIPTADCYYYYNCEAADAALKIPRKKIRMQYCTYLKKVPQYCCILPKSRGLGFRGRPDQHTILLLSQKYYCVF
jgi:hypothetical protein